MVNLDIEMFLVYMVYPYLHSNQYSKKMTSENDRSITYTSTSLECLHKINKLSKTQMIINFIEKNDQKKKRQQIITRANDDRRATTEIK